MGQDVFARLIYGTQTTLFVGFGAGFLMVAIGSILGAAAGYFGGFIDDLISLLINIFLVIPGLPLMVVLAVYLPPGPLTILAVLAFTGWAWQARVIRAQTLTTRQADFVAAAKINGEPAWRIIIF